MAVTTFKKKAAALGHSATSAILRGLYSPKCLEVEFSEVHIHHSEYPSLRAGAMQHLAGPMDRMLPQDVVGVDKDSLS
jgi:hypothetical protein